MLTSIIQRYVDILIIIIFYLYTRQIPFAVVINTGLIDMSPANGSTEIWPGTQLMAGIEAQQPHRSSRSTIRSNLIEERRYVRSPYQPIVPKGSIVVRDLRLWHCGKPNLTDEIRVMLAQIREFVTPCPFVHRF